MGQKRVNKLVEALRVHNVVIKDGKFFWEPEKIIILNLKNKIII